MAIQKLNDPFLVADFSSGLIDDLSVSKPLLPKNAVRKAINVIFNRPRGSIRQRLGTTRVGDAAVASTTILGVHNFRSSNSSYHQLLAVAGSTVYALSGTTWGSTTTVSTSGLKTRFITYLDRVAVLNGTDTPKMWDGSGSWETSGGRLDIGSFPVSKFATTINTRILAAGDSSNPDTISLSSLVSANAISWTSGNKTVQVSPQDGAGSITGVTGNGVVALIFKERGLYRYDDNTLQRVGYVGTPSYESIATDDNGITYFFGQGANGVGFYMTQGGRPIKISRAITRYVEAIAGSYYDDVAAYTDGTNVEWSVGSITIDGITYSNASFVYSVSDKTWTVYNRAHSFRVFSQYIDSSSNITVVGGDTAGNVQTIGSGNTDNGTAIQAEAELSPIVFTTRGRTKTVSEIMAFTEEYQGLSVDIRTDDNKWFPLGSLKEGNQHFHNFPLLRGNEFHIRLKGNNTATPWELTGFEFPAGSVQDEGYR